MGRRAPQGRDVTIRVGRAAGRGGQRRLQGLGEPGEARGRPEEPGQPWSMLKWGSKKKNLGRHRVFHVGTNAGSC